MSSRTDTVSINRLKPVHGPDPIPQHPPRQGWPPCPVLVPDPGPVVSVPVLFTRVASSMPCWAYIILSSTLEMMLEVGGGGSSCSIPEYRSSSDLYCRFVWSTWAELSWWLLFLHVILNNSLLFVVFINSISLHLQLLFINQLALTKKIIIGSGRALPKSFLLCQVFPTYFFWIPW